MKNFKHIMIVIIVCCIGSTNAKRMVQAIQPNTFLGLVQFIKIAPNIWQPEQNRFSDIFITDLTTKAQAANLKNFQLGLLLDMTRDYRVPFTGNSDQDLIIVNNCSLQKESTVQNYARLTGQPIQGKKEVRSPSSDESLLNNADIEAFVQQLIDQNKAKLEAFATPEKSFSPNDSNYIFGEITSGLKNKFPDANPAQLKTVLINKIEANFPVIKELNIRRGDMLNFMNLNMPNKPKPTKETVPSEELPAQEPQQPYSAEATKGKQSSQPDKDIIGYVEQIVEANRTYIENFIKLESFNNQDTFEVFAPITSALKEKYPDMENQKKLKPILITTLNRMFPDMIGDLKMGSIYTILNNNLP